MYNIAKIMCTILVILYNIDIYCTQYFFFICVQYCTYCTIRNKYCAQYCTTYFLHIVLLYYCALRSNFVHIVHYCTQFCTGLNCRWQVWASTRCKSRSKMLTKRKSGMWCFQNLLFSLWVGPTTFYTGTLTRKPETARWPCCFSVTFSTQLRLVHSSGRAQRDFRRLEISSQVFATGAIF